MQREEDVKPRDNIFADKDIGSFVTLAETLARIHRRLMASGYKIKDGRLIAPSKS